MKGANTKTVSYKIERMRMNTGVDALNDTMWQFIGRATGDTSFADRLRSGRMRETRMYRVGSEATSILGVVFVDDPGVMYALHPEMHMPSMPQMVTATADSDTAVTVSWATPADDGGSDITGFTVRWKQSDATRYAAADMAMADAMASSHMVSGLMGSTSYDFQVIATNAIGDSYPSMAATAMTMATVTELTAPSAVMATDTTTNPGNFMIEVTWTAGENADGGHLVLLFPSDFSDLADTAVPTEEGRHSFTGVSPATMWPLWCPSSQAPNTCMPMTRCQWGNRLARVGIPVRFVRAGVLQVESVRRVTTISKEIQSHE